MHSSGRILHLGHDDKFIDAALEIFESVAPGRNDLYLVSQGDPKRVSFPPAKLISPITALLSRGLGKEKDYAGVVVHSLNPLWYRILLKVDSEIPIVWLGWGYDYYGMLSPLLGSLILPRTESLLRDIQGRSVSEKLVGLRRLLASTWREKSVKKLLERIDYFAPVLPNEYELVQRVAVGQRFPKQLLWVYSGGIDDALRATESKVMHGYDIMVGNSSHPENNHLEVFDMLQAHELANRSVVVPLSYGSLLYRQAIVNLGERVFGESFHPLTDFLPLPDYIAMLQTCGFAIMNHVRQQGLGNIIIMLYLGAKVFLRPECPTYRFLKEKGAVVFTIKELEAERGMLASRLDEASVRKNKAVIRDTWSRAVNLRMAEEIVRVINSRCKTVGHHEKH